MPKKVAVAVGAMASQDPKAAQRHAKQNMNRTSVPSPFEHNPYHGEFGTRPDHRLARPASNPREVIDINQALALQSAAGQPHRPKAPNLRGVLLYRSVR